MSVVHLVDDDVAVTEACQFLLEGVGYAGVTSENGKNRTLRPRERT